MASALSSFPEACTLRRGPSCSGGNHPPNPPAWLSLHRALLGACVPVMDLAGRRAGSRYSSLLFVPRTQLCTQRLLGCQLETVTMQLPTVQDQGRGTGPKLLHLTWAIGVWPRTCLWRKSQERPGTEQQKGSGTSWGQTGRKIFRKMSTSPLATAPRFPREVSPSMRLKGLTDALPPCPALLLRGRRGPALRRAPPAARGQTQRQPAAHLPALPH